MDYSTTGSVKLVEMQGNPLEMDQSRLKAKVKDMLHLYAWYGDLLPAEPWKGLEDLPLLTADILEQHYYQGEPLQGTAAVYRTSGTSSGRRKQIYYSNNDEQRYMEGKVKLFGRLLSGFRLQSSAADMGTGHAADTAAAIFGQLGMRHLAIPYTLPIGEHLRMLREFRPQLLYTMPSILEQIVYHATNPSQYGIEAILLVGEIASQTWMARMAEAFRIAPERIMDTLGSIEIGTIAYYSHPHKRYLFVDGLHPEALKPEQLGWRGDLLGDDEAVLVLTSWERDLFPALRYVTYDVIRDFRIMDIDGCKRPTFAGIVKRIGAELKHGEKISLYDIEQVVYRIAADAAIRVKVAGNQFTVYLQSKSLDENQAEAIKQQLRQQLPEIGTMIRNGLVGDMEVRLLKPDDPLPGGTVKNKKIYYE